MARELEPLSRLLRAADLAAILGVSTPRVHQMWAEHKLPEPIRIGRSRYIERERWEQFLASQTEGSNGAD
jgi:predicted DNA-binding transcriptional regulator AlpA